MNPENRQEDGIHMNLGDISNRQEDLANYTDSKDTNFFERYIK